MAKQIVITLEDEDHNYLISVLERHLEKLTDGQEIREVAKLIEKLDNDYKEID